jgi:hypothetical protein
MNYAGVHQEYSVGRLDRQKSVDLAYSTQHSVYIRGRILMRASFIPAWLLAE